MSKTETALKELGQYRDKISQSMAEYFESDLAKESIRFTAHGEETFALIREFSERDAKRIRGSLTMMAYKMFGGNPDDRAPLEAAVAIELIQNYLLIIDDVMDRSITRRGGPTLHVQYHKNVEDIMSKDEAKHYSDMLAVNAGLIVQHMAQQVIAQLDIDPKIVQKAMLLVNTNIITTGYGQIEDLYNNAVHDASEEDILRLHKQKTSYYTFVNPTQLGALLAGADVSDLRALEDYGVNAGIAFQLHDDIIGLFGAEASSGKSAKDDLKEGKMTLLIKRAYANASSEDKKAMKKALGNPNITTEQHLRVQQIVDSTGSHDYSDGLKKEYAQKAIDVVKEQDWNQAGKDFLIGLVEYSINRVK